MTEIEISVETYVLMGQGNDSQWARLPCALRFSTADPLATVMHLGDDEPNSTDWTFALDLLVQICSGPTAGIGDVRFSHDVLDSAFVLLRLSSPDGVAVLRMKAVHIRGFVSAVKSALSAQPGVDIVADSLETAINAILKGSTDPR